MMARFSHVAVTRDERPDGPLSQALLALGLEPVPCPAVREAPPSNPEWLRQVAARVEHYDWLVVASRRAVTALMHARFGKPLPPTLRTAAVGKSTAAALLEFGARAPLTAERAGAEALAEVLLAATDWTGKRVLMPRAEEGGRVLTDALTKAGAEVVEVEAYRTVPVEPERLAGTWMRSSPEAVIIASPSAARSLVDAIGVAMLHRVVVIALGSTTAAALAELGVTARVPERTDFRAAAELAAECLGSIDADPGERRSGGDDPSSGASCAGERPETAERGGVW